MGQERGWPPWCAHGSSDVRHADLNGGSFGGREGASGGSADTRYGGSGVGRLAWGN
jgi:hypothetical protein